MSEFITVGEAVTRFLEACGVKAAYGVISIHNMPILDAIGRRGNIRFVPSRGEAGAVNMADAHARVANMLGVAVTSTGTAAGNAAGAMVEAQSAGTPLLHLTGQVETIFLDRDLGYIHEARDQLGMLKAVSKAAYRVDSADTVLAVLREAVRVAWTAPSGPVSVEIPIDIQQAEIPIPEDFLPSPPEIKSPAEAELDQLADRLADRRRPLLWLGGGARHAGEAVRRLVEMGFGVVSSTQGRGILPETHPMSLGAFTAFKPVEAFYSSCDAMLVAGSRLRGNETLTYRLALPSPLFRIDANPKAVDAEYRFDQFVCADAALVLGGLADRLEGRIAVESAFAGDLAEARAAAEAFMRDGLGPYNRLVDAVSRAAGATGDDFIWVRDVTISNSTWGNRLPALSAARDGVHALGGGIGQGLPMAIGAAIGAALSGDGRKVVALVGDGGLQLCIGELATAVQEAACVTLILMNSRDYGVIRNIQNAQYGGRNFFADLLTPDFANICEAVGLPHRLVSDLDKVAADIEDGIRSDGPNVIEIDMNAVGPFARAFAGPPNKTGK